MDRLLDGSSTRDARCFAAAEALVAIRPLRTLDAVHVASAQLFAVRVPAAEMIFVSADTRQTEAAAAIGLTVRPIASA